MKAAKLLLFSIIAAGIFMVSCGKAPEAGQDSTIEEGKRDQLIQGEVVEETDLDIGGRHYEWVKCRMGGNGIRIIGMRTKEDVLVIPSDMFGFRVAAIGGTEAEIKSENSSYGQESRENILLWNTDSGQNLKEIVIPEGIEEITEDAFAYIRAEETVLPESIKKVGERAFEQSSITKVVVKGRDTTLCHGVFQSSALKEIVLPEDYQADIGSYCFADTFIEKFDCPAGVEEIDFLSCCKDLKEITFTKNHREIIICKEVFSGCPSLKKLVFPAGVELVQIEPNHYADNNKEGSVETLVFLGKETCVECIDPYRGKVKDFIPAGEIVAPKGSKALQIAKRSKKIGEFTPFGKEKISGGDKEEEYYDIYYLEGKCAKWVPMEYKEV